MATQLFLRSTASDLGGAGQKALSLARGAASTTAVTSATAGGTNIIVTQTGGGQQLTWYSSKLNAQSISGTVDVNIRGFESVATVNAGAGILIERVNSAGVVQSTILSDRTVPAAITEYTISPDAAKNSVALAITATTFAAGDRIKVTLKVRNVGTMAAGTVTNSYDGPTAAAAGDTYTTFSANLVFQNVTAPTTTTSQNLAAGTGTRSFTAVTTQAGDYIVVQVQGEDGGTLVNVPPSASGLTFTAQVNVGVSGRPRIQIWTALDTTGGSRTVTMTPSVSNRAYFARLSVLQGVSAIGSARGIQTAQTITTPYDPHSLLVMAVSDWDAGAVGSPTWVPGGATTYSEQHATGTFIAGRWDDTGATAATTAAGISAPVYTTPGVGILELRGVSGAAAPPTDVAGSDTGSATDGTATLAVTLTPATDAETAVDAGTLATALTPATDTSSMVDAATVSTLLAKSGADTALAVDAGTLLASFSGSESGGSQDAPSGPLSATLTGADTSTRVEAYQLTVVLQSADTGAGTDAGSVGIGVTDKSGSETATAVDVATLAASHTRADTAGASDVATLVVTITGSDLRSVVDTVLALAATHQGADTGTQVEGYSLLAGGNQSSGESSATVEAGTLAVQLAGSDTSSATENQSVVQGASKSGSDTASLSAENRTLAVQLTANEIVTAVDAMLSLSSGGNQAGSESSATAETYQLTVQVTGTDGATTVDQGAITLFKASTENVVLVENAQLLARLTVAEIYAAIEVLAVLTGPQTWKFISADVRTITNGHESKSSRLPGITGGTRIDISVTW